MNDVQQTVIYLQADKQMHSWFMNSLIPYSVHAVFPSNAKRGKQKSFHSKKKICDLYFDWKICA